jgi:hypothetical protein
MATKKPTKSFIVSQTKRANNRLKVIGDTCLNLAQGRDTRQPERVQKQINTRLDRELTPSDIAVLPEPVPKSAFRDNRRKYFNVAQSRHGTDEGHSC